MESLKLPELPPLVVDGVVAVSTAELQQIVDTLNAVIAHANRLQETVDAISTELKTCGDDISKIAEILEEMYD